MKSKTLTLQRAAQRAMKDAAHIGVDPLNSVIVQGACFTQPSAVRLIRSFERKEAAKRKEDAQTNARRRYWYSRAEAIDGWQNENE